VVSNILPEQSRKPGESPPGSGSPLRKAQPKCHARRHLRGDLQMRHGRGGLYCGPGRSLRIVSQLAGEASNADSHAWLEGVPFAISKKEIA
jgi:hypothetical protein